MLLTLALAGLGTALALGVVAAFFVLRSGGRPAPWWIAGAHGAAALGSYGILLAALPGLGGGADTGTGSFAIIAAVLLGAAAIAGLVLLTMHLRKRRASGGLVGVHATLAVSGFVILAAYALLA